VEKRDGLIFVSVTNDIWDQPAVADIHFVGHELRFETEGAEGKHIFAVRDSHGPPKSISVMFAELAPRQPA